MTRPPVYIAGNRDGAYTAFVEGRGFRANDRLSACLEFIREVTGRSSGAVPFWDHDTSTWGSEFDLAEGAEAA